VEFTPFWSKFERFYGKIDEVRLPENNVIAQNKNKKQKYVEKNCFKT
jgi:hypothetical protein